MKSRPPFPIPKTAQAALFACALAFPPSLSEAVTLADIFSDHAVVQRGEKTPVWGTAAPGEKVSVHLGTASAEATAGPDGLWRTALDLRKEEDGPFDLVADGADGKTVRSDILVGEVWICAGQSNMHYHLSDSTGGAEEAAQASDPKLRFLNLGMKVAEAPTTAIRDKWAACDAKSAGAFSGVGYHMGKVLREQLNTPVGLVGISWAGTCIEAWMSPEALSSDVDFKPILDRWERKLADYPAKKAEYDRNRDALLAAWQQEADKAKAEGKPAPSRDSLEPPHGAGSLEEPSGLFHGEVTPVAPYGIGGILWYQGEQNVGRAFQYRKLLPALIADWRKLWGRGDFPFVLVQLPNYGKPETQPRSNNFAELREGQAQAAARLPNAALVVTIDVGEEGNIHPKDKKTVGIRAGRLIAKEFYAAPLPGEVRGPTFRDLAVEGESLRVRFDHAAGLATSDGQPPSDFAVAGADGRYVWAQASIEGDAVVLRAPGIPSPATVRYDWAASPRGNLRNGDGLPAAPFRTDSMKVSTEGIN
ncbi:sialate O-acetylesterase [Verrucomicrobium sp. GAS474]|uniref:sialate O-acetylesterase n=1 Tax=Verrucomicrobium sp. GAS474 TaxID=1882831 RepID=UPI00087D0AED|nr:sialate O-acetylesterase [Verrucomicrobium sp. GAS474]SDU29308.1 sialate O-acetylesterase [Verrucomicrobium sp. GAS474]